MISVSYTSNTVSNGHLTTIPPLLMPDNSWLKLTVWIVAIGLLSGKNYTGWLKTFLAKRGAPLKFPN